MRKSILVSSVLLGSLLTMLACGGGGGGGSTACPPADPDSDADGVCDSADGCPLDRAKIAPGACGCGVADTDANANGIPDCLDGCPMGPDADGDGVCDDADGCPLDAAKVTPGACGCGVPDTDSDLDGVADCIDRCPGFDDRQDSDGDGFPNACDARVTYGFRADGVTDLNSFVIRVHGVQAGYFTSPSGGDGAVTAGWCDGSSFNDLGGGDYSLLCFHPSPTGGVSGTDVEFARFEFNFEGQRPDCLDISVVSTTFADANLNALNPSVTCEVVRIQ